MADEEKNEKMISYPMCVHGKRVVDCPPCYIMIKAAINPWANKVNVLERMLMTRQRQLDEAREMTNTWHTRAEAHRQASEQWQEIMRSNSEAFSAMRDSINESLPLPSSESDLLQGPEFCVSCFAVAEGVTAAIDKTRAQAEMIRACLQTVRDKAFGSSPEETAMQNIDAIERGITALRMENYELRDALRVRIDQTKALGSDIPCALCGRYIGHRESCRHYVTEKAVMQ